MSVTVDEEIIKRLPKSFQKFRAILNEAGINMEEVGLNQKEKSENKNHTLRR